MSIEEASPWINGDMGHWAALTEEYHPVMVKKNEILYHQEDVSEKVYIVESGRICVTSYQADGGEKQIFIAERGALFGETSCVMELPCFTTAVAIVDSMVYAVPFVRVKAAMQEDWELSYRIMQMLCRKNLILLQQVRELSSSGAVQRVAQVLVNLCRQYGEARGDAIRIGIRFTHQDVANLIKASRVTVSNVFQMFLAEEILEKREGRFWIKKIDRLQAIASKKSQ